MLTWDVGFFYTLQNYINSWQNTTIKKVTYHNSVNIFSFLEPTLEITKVIIKEFLYSLCILYSGWSGTSSVKHGTPCKTFHSQDPDIYLADFTYVKKCCRFFPTMNCLPIYYFKKNTPYKNVTILKMSPCTLFDGLALTKKCSNSRIDPST